jgi:hypothetical protein
MGLSFVLSPLGSYIEREVVTLCMCSGADFVWQESKRSGRKQCQEQVFKRALIGMFPRLMT